MKHCQCGKRRLGGLPQNCNTCGKPLPALRKKDVKDVGRSCFEVQVMKRGRKVWIKRQIVIDFVCQGDIFIFTLGPIARQWVIATQFTKVCLTQADWASGGLKAVSDGMLHSVVKLLVEQSELNRVVYNVLFRNPISGKTVKELKV